MGLPLKALSLSCYHFWHQRFFFSIFIFVFVSGLTKPTEINLPDTKRHARVRDKNCNFFNLSDPEKREIRRQLRHGFKQKCFTSAIRYWGRPFRIILHYVKRDISKMDRWIRCVFTNCTCGIHFLRVGGCKSPSRHNKPIGNHNSSTGKVHSRGEERGREEERKLQPSHPRIKLPSFHTPLQRGGEASVAVLDCLLSSPCPCPSRRYQWRVTGATSCIFAQFLRAVRNVTDVAVVLVSSLLHSHLFPPPPSPSSSSSSVICMSDWPSSFHFLLHRTL